MHDTAKAIDALHSIPPDLPRDEWVTGTTRPALGRHGFRLGRDGLPRE